MSYIYCITNIISNKRYVGKQQKIFRVDLINII